MQYRTLGSTGVKVSRLCLGAMNLGSWAVAEQRECDRIVHAALDAGVNIIDTADVYSAGESEERVGAAIAGRRGDVILATKFHAPMGHSPNRRGNSRRWITLAVEDSLRRLDTDWIDVYQAHRPDPDTDIGETIATLDDLVRAGKIRYYGTSTFAPHELVEAQWAAVRRRANRPVSEQPPYSILVRKVEREVLPVCRQYDLGVLCWSPLAGGWLSGSFIGRTEDAARATRAQRMPKRFDLSHPGNQAKVRAVERLAEVAVDAGMTLPQLAIAFVLEHPAITSAITGPRTVEQFKSLLPAVDLRLHDDVLDRIDAIVSPGSTVNADDDDHVVPRSLTDLKQRRTG